MGISGAFNAASLLGLTVLGWVVLTNCAQAQSVPPAVPVAPAELGNGPIDEAAQLERIRAALKDHYRPENEDTRFIIDRNDKGIFRMMRYVGLVHFPADDNPKQTKIGTGTLLSDCFVLTSYHVLEGRDVIDGNKMPLPGRRVMFSFGPKPGRVDGFNSQSLGAVAHEPGILNFSDRRWSDDIILLRLDDKLPRAIEYTGIGHAFNKPIKDIHIGQITSNVVSLGFPDEAISRSHQFALYADMCRIISATNEMGFSTNCIATKGMSGGPLFSITNESGRQVIVGLAVQAAVGNGRFSKGSTQRSFFAHFTPAKIAKIRAIIDRPTDDHCMPTDGKPW